MTNKIFESSEEEEEDEEEEGQGDNTMNTIMDDSVNSVTEVPARKRRRKEPEGGMYITPEYFKQALLEVARAARGGDDTTLEYMKNNTQVLEKMSEKMDGKKEKSLCKEERVILIDEDIKVKDNGVDVIDTVARSMLGKNPNNSDPGSWWKEIPDVARPRLAETQQFGHITPCHIARETVWKFHDRREFLELRHFSAKNSGVTGKVSRKIDVETGGMEDGYAVASEMDYKKVESLNEAMEAVVSVVNLGFMIRNYDYGPLVMLTTLQKVNWFSGVARSDLEIQKKLVVSFADQMLRQNATRGVEKREPLVYKDALEEAKKVCHAHGINDACLFFGGAYVGGKNSQETTRK